MVEPHLYAVVGIIFYVGIDLAMSLYYSGKYGDGEWKKVKPIGIFTKSLRNAMKNNSEITRKDN